MKKTLLLVGLCTLAAFALGFSLAQTTLWKPKPKATNATRILIVTGGHDHDADFYSVFDDDAIDAKVNPHPLAFTGDMRKRYDVIVLYDMIAELEPKKQANLKAFVESGKGIVALHHAVCGNQNWPWWYNEVLGGRYLFEAFEGKKSSYIHDIEETITPVGNHPITRGIKPFRILDETYKDVWISPKVTPLLKSDHPTSNETVGWISPYDKARVVYIQLGHDRNANLNPNYQRLVRNAIQWTAGKLQ
ncbi:MAG TPA: ThuA domain-containing protein [Blastocatellia bacterium]|nr:ThuA domain-containing protein [Blastocatellia bacterium]